MSVTTDHRTSSLVSPEISEDITPEILEIRTALKNPHEITSNQVWPFCNIIKHAKVLIPATHTRAGSIPITIATFLYEIIRQSIGTDNRLDLAANNMLEEDVKKYHPYWIEIMYSIFLNFCACSSARTRRASAKRNAVLSSIFGTLEQDENSQSGSAHGANRSALSNFTTNPNFSSSMDLPKSIQAMTNIIPVGEKLDGDETKPFTDRLEPILDQMKAASNSDQHHWC